MNSKQKKTDSAFKEKRLISNEKANKENGNKINHPKLYGSFHINLTKGPKVTFTDFDEIWTRCLYQ